MCIRDRHNDSYSDNTYGFVNNITTPEGGTHVVGFRNAITKTFNDYARKNKLLRENEPNLSGEDIREGLTAIISVKIEDPQFEGQTKQKLGNSEARGAVDNVVSRQLEIFLEQNPAVGKIIVEKSVMSQRAREAARKARDPVSYTHLDVYKRQLQYIHNQIFVGIRCPFSIYILEIFVLFQ